MAEQFLKAQGHFKIGHFEAFISESCIIYILSIDSFGSTLQVDSSKDIAEWETFIDHYSTS